MSLPEVKGWIIDFRTADMIFRSGSNLRINHVVSKCQSGLLKVCHHEEQRFRDEPGLKRVFLKDQDCVYDPDDDVYQTCETIAENPLCRSILAGNKTAIFITAIASCSQLGVISDHVSASFTTVHNLCLTFGVPVFTADEYFSLLIQPY